MYYHVFIQGSICSRVFKGEICSRAVSVQGSICSRQYLFKGNICSRQYLFKGSICSKQYLSKGSIYSRGGFIMDNILFMWIGHNLHATEIQSLIDEYRELCTAHHSQASQIVCVR